jgi:ferrous iron transport protein A
MPSDNVFPLAEATTGQQVRLVSIHGGRQLAHRLVEMGLTPGVRLRILQNSGGPLLLAVSDSRIALGWGMAQKVDVTFDELP